MRSTLAASSLDTNPSKLISKQQWATLTNINCLKQFNHKVSTAAHTSHTSIADYNNTYIKTAHILLLFVKDVFFWHYT